MNFRIEKKKAYAIITMETERLDSQTVPELRSELVLLSGEAIRFMILDMSKCTSCDANGSGAILIANRLCKDGQLILAGVQPNVESILAMTKFDPMLMIISTLEEAEAQMISISAE